MQRESHRHAEVHEVRAGVWRRAEVDLSPGMVVVARREYPDFANEVADLRELPFADASPAGVVCWFSLIYLAPNARVRAFA